MSELAGTITGPREALQVANEFAYRQFARRVLVKTRGHVNLTERDERLIACVNHGRWIVFCDCGGAAEAGYPGWDGGTESVAICCTCGSVYRPVFPLSREAVETVLLARPEAKQRNFTPCPDAAIRQSLPRAERLATLLSQNKEQGDPKRRMAAS